MPGKNEGKAGKLSVGIRAVPWGDWVGFAGYRFRKIMNAISEAAGKAGVPASSDLPSKAIELGYAKLEGLARKEQAAAVKDFREAEDKNIDTILKSRALEHRVRKEKAEADKAELEVVDAQLNLIAKLKDARVVLRRDEDGNYIVSPELEGTEVAALAIHVKSLASSKALDPQPNK